MTSKHRDQLFVAGVIRVLGVMAVGDMFLGSASAFWLQLVQVDEGSIVRGTVAALSFLEVRMLSLGST